MAGARAGSGGESPAGGGAGAGADAGGTGGDVTTAGSSPGGSDSGSAGATQGGASSGAGGSASGSTSAGSSGSAGQDTCAPPYVAELTTALSAALPNEFTWTDFIGCKPYSGCSALACSTCQSSPCGTCSLTWTNIVVLPDATRAYVDVSAHCSVPGRYGCSGSTNAACTITMEGPGTLSIVFAGNAARDGAALSWAITSLTPSLNWASTTTTCGSHAFDEAAAATDLDAELGAMLSAVNVSGSCL